MADYALPYTGLEVATKLGNIPTQLSQLTQDSTHRTVTDAEKTTWNGKGTYSKPSGGIPETDLSSAVQTSLGRADTALQSVPSAYRTAAAQDTIDAGKLGTDKIQYSSTDIGEGASLATGTFYFVYE